ncbi:MAG: hypothetical protein ACRDRL_11945 [Sciscionella sp.]
MAIPVGGTVRGRVATVILDRPERRSAIDTLMAQALVATRTDRSADERIDDELAALTLRLILPAVDPLAVKLGQR